ncbi:uncharacterized protein MONBRDRAFT_28052 [Monosiga brevicollis MX1]|uniref:HRDC domain-containing protein n=1 Tax=Monosiga brevicollis TaxID=81824 RepID=A9V721_MONBE|nr:uncharacterized protein MONBRDRAFT_28052 [Monosiga brevicollis MX1]EDQ86714.1 predicted protein [Monosiga brevicollis MX1]|eukprot:XP_001748550.1 hypothetical protein [Monosiga brevicollis MX1]
MLLRARGAVAPQLRAIARGRALSRVSQQHQQATSTSSDPGSESMSTSPTFALRQKLMPSRFLAPLEDGRQRLYASSPEHLQIVMVGTDEVAAAPDVVAVDTEFVHFPMYRPKLEVLQIGTETTLAAVDCAAYTKAQLKELTRVLAQKEIILHSGQTDLDLLTEVNEAPLERVFDTQLAYLINATLFIRNPQVAANLLGIRNTIGLADLVTHMFPEVKMDKGQALSDWRVRPLNDEQLLYAISDVEHLIEMRHRLQDALSARGVEAWFQEDMRTLLTPRPTPADEDLWLDFRRLNKVRELPTARAILRALVAWREQTARARNVATPIVVRDDVLLSIAIAQPSTTEQIMTFQGVKMPFIKHNASDILNLVQRAAEEEAPELPPRAIFTNEPVKDDVIVALTRAFLASKALQMGMSPDALLTNDFSRFMVGLPSVLDQGWRRELLHAELEQIQRGACNLTWDASAALLVIQQQ